MRPTTEEGKIVGTIAYMSPEQAEGKKVDARSDIFSFGSVLYEMVTGKQAFHGDTKASTLAAILKDNPRAASQVVDGLPREVERLISRCLRKEVNQRSQHMDDVKLALQELKEESDSGVLGTAAVLRPKPRRFTWALSLAAALVVATVGVWLVRSKKEVPEVPLVAVPLTSYPGDEAWPSFSPDGTQVAFDWDGEKQDKRDIYVKQVGVEPPYRLTNDPAMNYGPAWSPDGRLIAFLRDISPSKTAIMLIPQRGGSERILAEVNGPLQSIPIRSILILDAGLKVARQFDIHNRTTWSRIVLILNGNRRTTTADETLQSKKSATRLRRSHLTAEISFSQGSHLISIM